MQYRRLAFIIFLSTRYFLLATFLCGCASEYNLATGREESLFYSTDKEINLGRSIAKQVEAKYKLVEDPAVQEKVGRIGQKIAEVCDRKELVYYFKALDGKEVNAVSLPGGFVYIYKGLIDIASVDELAGVIAHEVAHIVARHSIKKLQASMGYMLARIITAQTTGSAGAVYGADLAFSEVMLGYSREDELLADKVGVRYVERAGFDPHAMISFLAKLKETKRKEPLAPLSYGRTHPYIADRISVVKQELGENISFTDYINREGE